LGSGVNNRHYGFLSSTWKQERLKILQEKLQVKVLEKVEKKSFLPKCPCCKTDNLHRIAVLTSVDLLLGILAVAKNQFPVKVNFMGKGFCIQM
jgi:hypothetical protein